MGEKLVTEHHISKLNDFHKASDEIDNLVIIPSGYVMGKPPAEHFNETEQLNRLKTKYISITLPYDNNIYNGNFSNVSWREEISHSPKGRAEMIYEAISAKNDDGSYKYNNIYFTGGSNTEDVIFELEKICQKRGELPKRKDNLKTYGFSDATQLHHYLGQRGISSPVYYSKNIYALIDDLKEKNSNTTNLNIEPLNDTAKKINEINGYLQPGNQSQVENRQSHQTRFFQDGSNFLVCEFGNKDAVEAFLQTCKHFEDENIVLLLSRDTNKEAIDYLAQNSKFPIFTGMPVGHGSCQKDGAAINLFSSANIQKTDKGYNLNFSDKSSDKVFNLSKNQTRIPISPKGGNEDVAILKKINGSAGAVFANFQDIKIGLSSLTIKIPQDTQNLIQVMEMSVKTLIEQGVIKTETLESLSFQSSAVDEKNQAIIKKRINDLKKRYLPQLKEIKLNGNSISNDMSISIANLRGLSTSQKAPYKPHKININLQTLRLYKDKKIYN